MTVPSDRYLAIFLSAAATALLTTLMPLADRIVPVCRDGDVPSHTAAVLLLTVLLLKLWAETLHHADLVC